MKQEDELETIQIDEKDFKTLVKRAKKDKRLSTDDIRKLEIEHIFPTIWIEEMFEELKNEG